jgi:hypothetical protein
MWQQSELEIDIAEVWPPYAVFVIRTPVGDVKLLGIPEQKGDTLILGGGAHIEGPGENTIGISGLIAIGRKILAVANVKRIVIDGARRTTGRCMGKIPLQIRFP